MITLFFLESITISKDTSFNLLAKIRKLFPEEPIYALGVHFSYDEQLAAKKNVVWSTRPGPKKNTKHLVVKRIYPYTEESM